MTHFEEDGLNVSKKEVIFEVEKVLQKKTAQMCTIQCREYSHNAIITLYGT